MASTPITVAPDRSRRENVWLAVVILSALIVLSALVFGAFGIWTAAESSQAAKSSSAAAASSSAATLALTKAQAVTTARYHAEVVAQNTALAQKDADILNLISVLIKGEALLITDHMQTASQIAQVATLQQQLAQLAPLIAGLPTADAYLAQLASALITNVNALCLGNPACVHLPSVP